MEGADVSTQPETSGADPKRKKYARELKVRFAEKLSELEDFSNVYYLEAKE